MGLIIEIFIELIKLENYFFQKIHLKKNFMITIHTLSFVDILDGGLIKLSISILLIVSIISIFVKLFLRNEYIMSGLILIYGANYLYSQSIDSINGIFENRLTYIFLIISYAGAFILDEKEKNY